MQARWSYMIYLLHEFNDWAKKISASVLRIYSKLLSLSGQPVRNPTPHKLYLKKSTVYSNCIEKKKKLIGKNCFSEIIQIKVFFSP